MKEENLYFKNSQYKEVLLINELINIVKKNGGSLCENKYSHNYIIHNRTIDNIIIDLQVKIERLEEALKKNSDILKNDMRQKVILSTQKEVEKWEELRKLNPAIKTKYKNYVSFIYDGFYYYVQFDENPFFEHMFHKIPVKKESDNVFTYQGKYYIDNMELEDNIIEFLFKYDQTEKEIKEIASKLFDYLINEKPSERYYEYERRRVCNTFNSGYHYEKVLKNGSNKITKLNISKDY